MPKMSEINIQKNRYFKVPDLLDLTGEKAWARAQLNAIIESASIGKYKDDDADDAYFVKFQGIEKNLGCNLTIRQFLAGMVGDDAEWDTATLGGIPVCIYVEGTSMGPGVRLRAQAPANVQVGGQAMRPEDEPPPPGDADNPGFSDDGGI